MRICYIRYCKWEDCKNRVIDTTHYCEEHKLNAWMKQKIRTSERNKKFNEELKQLKKDVYDKLYKEIQGKVLKELDQEKKELEDKPTGDDLIKESKEEVKDGYIKRTNKG